ncbi:hypothetical protein QQZ08_010253 [Neonectria magnoliae]|uniref:Uncharacterized protein n=1 Tax=Neonectria magnoliae TaxID=2732573 RepID=A0ABR1HHQ8_9HYPO
MKTFQRPPPASSDLSQDSSSVVLIDDSEAETASEPESGDTSLNYRVQDLDHQGNAIKAIGVRGAAPTRQAACSADKMTMDAMMGDTARPDLHAANSDELDAIQVLSTMPMDRNAFGRSFRGPSELGQLPALRDPPDQEAASGSVTTVADEDHGTRANPAATTEPLSAQPDMVKVSRQLDGLSRRLRQVEKFLRQQADHKRIAKRMLRQKKRSNYKAHSSSIWGQYDRTH